MHRLPSVFAALSTAVLGQDVLIRQTLAGILAGGHVLLVGVPGLAKTTLVQAIARVLGLDMGRIQGTPDLMPADILGAEVLEQDAAGQHHFRLIKGPVFCQSLLADEINRASPRTQAALLQAMQEREVTIAGKTYPLPKPFHVLATQNPLEQEGTYPLPEAQLDRFLLNITITYPQPGAERDIVVKTAQNGLSLPDPVAAAADLCQWQQDIAAMPVSDHVVDGIMRLVQATRPENDASLKEHIRFGAGTRAAQALVMTSRALAAVEGRPTPSLQDVKTLALPVLRHRIGLSYAAPYSVDGFVQHLCQKVL